MKPEEIKEEIKEEFCAPCLAAIPLAFAAGGTGAKTASDNINGTLNPILKKRLIGFVFIVVSIISYIVFKFIMKLFNTDCKECR